MDTEPRGLEEGAAPTVLIFLCMWRMHRALSLLASLGLLQLTSFISFCIFPAWEGAEVGSWVLTCKFQIDLFLPPAKEICF